MGRLVFSVSLFFATHFVGSRASRRGGLRDRVVDRSRRAAQYISPGQLPSSFDCATRPGVPSVLGCNSGVDASFRAKLFAAGFPRLWPKCCIVAIAPNKATVPSTNQEHKSVAALHPTTHILKDQYIRRTRVQGPSRPHAQPITQQKSLRQEWSRPGCLPQISDPRLDGAPQPTEWT